MSERKLRVLWFSNALLEPVDRGFTGTWLHAMAAGLAGDGGVHLGNVTAARVTALTRADHAGVEQWLAPPAVRLGGDGLPSRAIVEAYRQAVEQFKPDLIHVWGAETFPGLLVARGIIHGPALLEIQGLKGPLAEVHAGGMTLGEQLRAVGIKEIVRRSTIPQERRFYRRWGAFEHEIIRGHRLICAPSTWMQAQVRAANPAATLFHNELPLRQEILDAPPWGYSGTPTIFTSSSYPAPYKGLHTLIRAAAILKGRFPGLRLRIAGALQSAGIRQNGYVRWLNGLVRDLGLVPNVTWLGAIGGAAVARELASASVAAFPSFAESYGVAHAEAMAVGTPCALSFNGGSSYLAEHGRTGLFFPPGDVAVCADLVRELIQDREVATSLSQASRAVARARHDRSTIIGTQQRIYREALTHQGSKPQ